jgi:hypothetical protein
MPGEQAQFGRETGYAEHLDGLIREKRRKRDRCDTRFRESERRHSDYLSVAVAQRTVCADEFPDAVNAAGRDGNGRCQHEGLLSMSRTPATLKAAGLANRCCGVRYRGADAFGLVAVLSWQFEGRRRT